MGEFAALIKDVLTLPAILILLLAFWKLPRTYRIITGKTTDRFLETVSWRTRSYGFSFHSTSLTLKDV